MPQLPPLASIKRPATVITRLPSGDFGASDWEAAMAALLTGVRLGCCEERWGVVGVVGARVAAIGALGGRAAAVTATAALEPPSTCWRPATIAAAVALGSGAWTTAACCSSWAAAIWLRA